MMLLQVHDELVFEAPDDEVEATLKVVAKVMVDAPEPAVRLHVPLRVDAHAGRNGRQAHSACRGASLQVKRSNPEPLPLP